MAKGGPLGLFDGGFFKNATGKFSFPLISGTAADIVTRITMAVTERVTDGVMGMATARIDRIIGTR